MTLIKGFDRMEQLKIKQYLEKEADKSLSFRVFNLLPEYKILSSEPSQRDHFLILVIESGKLELFIEDKVHVLTAGKIAVVFPNQVHSIKNMSDNLSGKIILFEEVLFCSDILKNELSVYNVNLSTQLNCTVLANDQFNESLRAIALIQDVYEKPSLIRKEQARFNIKIFLLSLIESVHGQHPILEQHSPDQPLYVQFKTLLNQHYKEERTVQYYAEKLFITPKKLNTITKKHCGETAINAIHNRILIEIKRQLMFADITHKEIAFDLGFNSPAALNKFVKSKLNETPTQLQQELMEMYKV